MSAWCFPFEKGTPDKPSIFLLVSTECPRESISEIGAGCEEEGVPLAWAVREGYAPELAAEAAIRSRLEVGIGLGKEGAVVTFRKLGSTSGYVRFQGGSRKDLRNAGRAAGRLVKREPLPLEESQPWRLTEETREVRP